MPAARQIALTRLDPDLIFGVVFSSGGPSVFTPLLRYPHTSSHILSTIYPARSLDPFNTS